MAFRTMSGQSFTLGSSISSTQTTILLTSFLVPVTGTAITMATMGTDIAYATIAPGTSQSELISFTGVTQNADGTATLTGVTRGLDKQYPGTSVTAFKQPHAGQSTLILSDAPQIFNTEMAALRNDNVWVGRQQFPTSGTASAAVVGATYATPTQDTEIATKKYVDDTASFGAPLATTTTAGIVEISTATQLETGVLLGETGAGLVILNAQYGARKILGYNTTAGTPNAYTIDVGSSAPTAYATGQIVGFQASFANTGNATINVNGLGAKNLFLGSTGLFAGAIATSTYVGAVYDGTQFSIINSSSLINTTGANKIVLTKNDGTIDGSIIPSTSSNLIASESLSDRDLVTGWYYQSDGGITYDNKGAYTGSAASISQSFTVGNNSNRILIAVLTTNSASSADSATPSYGGVAMTQVGSSQDFASFNRTRVFRLFAPATGANNLTITFTVNPTNYSLALYSYYNVSQSALDGSAQATATTVNYTPTQSATLVFTCVTASSAPTGGANMQSNQQTSSQTGGSYIIFSGDSGQIVPFAQGTFSATGGSAINVIALAPATVPSFSYVAKASASNATNTIQANKYNAIVGFCIGTTSSLATASVQTSGLVTGLSGLTPLATYYASNTAGQISTTAGTNSRKVGVALSTTTLLIKQDNV